MNPELDYHEETLTVELVRDGTTTRVEIIDETGAVIGMGVARRRKGDKRNAAVGTAIAMQRAMRSSADAFSRVVVNHFTGRQVL
ncbi:hypothetical protein BJP40_06425 [Streptomyces sp. CC53]|uniref:dsRBD fold-containing protein n=1 Tax=Streptomyces sp. CC53 TaxID=1906740 RepID=UPI0008DD2524|nr:dsRBD fold-containing protein [Streptomyces sp. CC53]OII61158.1 hypothetical protein BJP40_06425 [Streptomyces sp. CC53]